MKRSTLWLPLLAISAGLVLLVPTATAQPAPGTTLYAVLGANRFPGGQNTAVGTLRFVSDTRITLDVKVQGTDIRAWTIRVYSRGNCSQVLNWVATRGADGLPLHPVMTNGTEPAQVLFSADVARVHAALDRGERLALMLAGAGSGGVTNQSPYRTCTNFGTTPPATTSTTTSSATTTTSATTTSSATTTTATTTTVIPGLQADLAITKTDGATSAVPGTSTTYTINVLNGGPNAVNGAHVADSFPVAITSATFSATAAGGASGFTASGSGNINDTVNLPVGSSITYTVVAHIDSAATGSLTNSATVSPPAGTTDTVQGNNTAIDTDTLTPRNDVSVTKTDGVTIAVPGTSTTYTIVVANTGPSMATSIAVSDPLPAGATSASWSGNGHSNVAGALSDTIASLATGASVTYAMTVQISPGATGSFTNIASVSAVGDTNPGNNTATDVNTLGTPAINIVKFVNGQDADTAPGPHVAAGSTVTFTYVVTNTGNVPLANVVVSDDKLGPVTSFTGDTNGNGLLDLTETWTYTRTATALAGQQTNTGTVTGLGAGTATTVSDSNPANYLGDAPAINIVKFVNGQDADSAPGPQVAVGSTVTFTYVVTNTGNVPLANVAVSDDKLGPITSFTGDTNANGLLDLTETWIYTATATALAGQQTNLATATAQDANNPPGTTVTDNNPANYFGA
jgi:uncharacterized repeat protein (TIGR01451 family)